MTTHKLLIGTASFSGKYGIANHKKMSRPEIASIFDLARELRVRGFDTAQDYSSSESLIGTHTEGENFITYTKISHQTDISSYVALVDSIKKSLKNLETDTLHGVAPHNCQNLLKSGREASDNFEKLKSEGYISNWGITVYSPREALKILDFCRPDYIQAPISLVDRRFLDTSFLETIKKRGIKLQARSIFLQGALLMSANELPDFLAGLRHTTRELSIFCQEHRVHIASLLFSLVANISEVDEVIVGINSASNLQDITSMKLSTKLSDLLPVLSSFQLSEKELDPRRWA